MFRPRRSHVFNYEKKFLSCYTYPTLSIKYWTYSRMGGQSIVGPHSQDYGTNNQNILVSDM